MIEPNDIPQEVVDAYTTAWKAKQKEIGRGIAPAGTKVRAGLTATFDAMGLEEFFDAYDNDTGSDGYSITPRMDAALEKIRKACGIDGPPAREPDPYDGEFM